MASNIFNEHIELEHLQYAIDQLIIDGYQISRNSFVSGMEFVDNF
jgi:hypothetical protein